jgi:N-ethylmaleimide reductase
MIMTTSALFEPYKLGDITFSNRVVMGPLTRNRAGEGLAPSPFAAEYYAERASAGLIIADPDLRHCQQDKE